MGYRSSGAIRIVGPKDRMLAELGALALLGDEYIRDALKEFIVEADGENEAILGLDFAGWKWYESYSDIQAFEKIWHLFESIEDDGQIQVFSGAFLRFGENDDDTEQRVFGDEGWGLIEYQRSYECAHVLHSKNDLRNNRSSSNEQESI